MGRARTWFWLSHIDSLYARLLIEQDAVISHDRDQPGHAIGEHSGELPC